MKRERFYIIGIAGVAMASLAGLLKKKGHIVAGSDNEMYPPMSDMLRTLKIPVFTPYSELHMKRWKPDTVVVGNAIGRGNPELEYAISNGLPYRSMSDILREEFIEGKKAIVISGTHGKTTTTALVAWMLEVAGLDPTVFVGGVAKNFGSTFKLGKGKYIVIEGDEYDTAFFDKGPKFWHYRPYVGLVNNIELDHIDIYKNIDAIKFVFSRFINLIPQNGLLVVSRENPNAYNLALNKAKSPVSTFGLKRGDYTLANSLSDIKPKIIGRYNMSNILGAIAIAKFLKISDAKIKTAIETFDGVKRRQEVIGEKNGITVIDDYAHHPTAVRETLIAIRKGFPGKRIVCLFEPGSASSKRRIFEQDYISSFSHADLSYMYKPFKAQTLKKRETFNGKYVSSQLNKLHVKSWNFNDIKPLLLHMKHQIRPGDVIVIMSCRGFDGLYKQIWNII